MGCSKDASAPPRGGTHGRTIPALFRVLSYLAVSASIVHAIATGDPGGWRNVIAPVLAGELLLAWGAIMLGSRPTGHDTEEEVEAARRIIRGVYVLLAIALLIVLAVKASLSGLFYAGPLYSNFRSTVLAADGERRAAVTRGVVALLTLLVCGLPLLFTKDETAALMLIGAAYFLVLPIAEAVFLPKAARPA